MRTKNSLYNLITAMGGQAIAILIGFLARLVFVRCLSQEYLGLTGVFTNVLSMLSLVELGVGPAITFALYKPLADQETERIKSLMQLYRKAYTAIGCIMLLGGLAFTPFYRFFITTDVEIPYLNVIYLLYLFNTAISYFYSYKRSILEADQKKYRYNILHYIIYTLVNVAQIISLVFTRNYLVFLTVQICFTWLENVAVSQMADREYPFLKDKQVLPLDQETTKPIWRNVKAMVLHKIGTIIVNSTDNLLLSKFIGLAAAGVYANYYLFTSALNKILTQVFNSVTASVGNLNVSNDLKKKRQIYDCLLLMNFWVYSWSTVGLICLLQPLIELMFGKEYLFDNFTVLMICLCYFTAGMRKTVLTYKDASGLYYRDWFKPLLEGVVNLIVSIQFLKWFGAAGIFMGTLVSTLGVSAWIEAYIVYKDILCRPFSCYLKAYVKYVLIAIFSCGITYWFCLLIPGVGITAFALKAITVILFPNILYGLVYYQTEEFQYYWNLLKTLKKKIRH